MINYKIVKTNLSGSEFIILKIDGNIPTLSIPTDPANTDYQTYLKWLDGYELQGMEWVKTSDGNTPLPADEPNEGTV